MLVCSRQRGLIGFVRGAGLFTLIHAIGVIEEHAFTFPLCGSSATNIFCCYILTPSSSTIFIDMNHAQCRAARALIEWSQTKLSQAASIGLSTVVDFERQRRQVSNESTAAMRAALESAGVVFLAENGGGPGVRLKKGSDE